MAFGLRYYAELRSKYKNTFWRVEIHQRDYVGVSERMDFEGSQPLQITWERRGDEFYIPVKGSEMTVNIHCKQNFKYIGLFTADPRKFRVSVYRNTKLYWRGYVVADLYSESFAAPPYQVTVKAVDGFNLLSSVKYQNLDGSNFTGRKSLWTLISSCIDLLELDINVADWMDLYAEGMSTTSSPLRQAYVDMDRLYMVYNEPTYRDVLELCLRPFSGQMFQSNGALHIRRTVSLYNDTRPMSFYNVGSEFPVGWIVAADGRGLITKDGEPIITETARDRIESIWEDDINISGESTMDIVPAVRKVIIDVKNKSLPNLVDMLGWMNVARWSNPYDCLSLSYKGGLQVRGHDDHKNHILTSPGYKVTQTTFIINLEMTLVAGYSYSGGRSSGGHTHRIQYAFVIVDSSKTYYLEDDGRWVTTETWFDQEIKTTAEENVKVEINGFPTTGTLYFKIKNVMIGTPPRPRETGSGGSSSGGVVHRPSYQTYVKIEYCTFQDIKFVIDTGDEYEKALKYEVLMNPANNVDMQIPLPIADIPNVPNDQLIFSLYYTDSTGKPTRMWHTKGRNDYDTLVNHLVKSALQYKQRPSRRIGGEMFTGKHIDMNTVVQDDKFLMAGFYVNSIELDVLEDSFDTELVEMPGLLNKLVPPTGDDCVKIAEFPAVPKAVVTVGNQIIALSASRVYAYDIASGTIKTVCTVNSTAKLFPADNAFALVEGKKITIYDFRGVIIKTYTDPSTYETVFATMMDGYIYKGNFIPRYLDDRGGGNAWWVEEHIDFSRPEYPYNSSGYRGNSNYTTMYGKYQGLVKSYSSIGVYTELWSCFFDKRIHETIQGERNEKVEYKTLSDYYMGINQDGNYKIYKRTTIADRTLIKTVTGKAIHADHTLGEFAYTQNNVIKVWTYSTNATRTIRNPAGNAWPILDIFYLNGELYIIRNKHIFKYIE